MPIIFSTKSYLICHQCDEGTVSRLTGLGKRLGFGCVAAGSAAELQDLRQRVRKLVAAVSIGGGEELKKAGFSATDIVSVPSGDASRLFRELDSRVAAGVPANLQKLIEASIPRVAEQLLGIPPNVWGRALEDSGSTFSCISSCDSTAEGLQTKVVSEINLELLRKSYPASAVAKKDDRQLLDAMGEIGNQILGTLNHRLREIGLRPLIALPLTVHADRSATVAQSVYMPMIRLLDRSGAIALSVSALIDPDCPAAWDRLAGTPSASAEVEFL
jgi:hypothetical protein